MFWVLAALPVVLIALAATYLTTRNISYLLYYLNWHHWPWWYAANLWILAVGTLFARFVGSRKIRLSLYVIMFVGIALITAFYSVWLHDLFYCVLGLFRLFYISVLCSLFYVPIANFFSDGVISWRLFVVPAAVLGLVTLILIRRNTKRRKKGEKSEGAKE
ncbi:MAG: hypothetical protein ACOX6D_03825 [Thermoguttaceae bacterium]